jgi:hypothetical protein
MTLTNPREEITEELIKEAKAYPGGYVYSIAGTYTENDYTPPGAIYGAWKVDDNGEIIKGSFERNPHFQEDVMDRRFKDLNEYKAWLAIRDKMA